MAESARDAIKPQGIKAVLQQIDSQILIIQKDLSDNQLKVVNLKNQKNRLQTLFQTKAQQTQRNLKLDLQGFENKIRQSFHAHNNMIKMLDKKLNQISDNQVELAETLLNVSQKVKQMEEMIG